MDGSLCTLTRGTGPARFDEHVSDLEHIISTETLGEEKNVTQWRFPIDQNASPQ